MADRLHLVDKPEGWTSHDAVARLRRILGERRVGHAGTLDPFATGLLVVAEGRATGLLGALALLPKRYLATLRLGVATDTQDRTGVPIDAPRGPLPTLARFDEALTRFRGRLEQRPPLYSAVKVAGERLYRAARRGEDVERPTRPVHVYALERVADGAAAGAAPAAPPSANTADVTIDLTVSRGTYVRTLAHDLGAALGCGAHLVALRRVSVGPFQVEGAGRVEKESGWDAARLRACAIPPATALGFLPRVRLDASEAARLRHGAGPAIGAERIVASDAGYPLPPGAAGWPLALLDPEGVLLAVAEPWHEQTPGAPLRLQRVVAVPAGARDAGEAGDAESAAEAARA
jgi:tRNA pseudouridine55 synthase